MMVDAKKEEDTYQKVVERAAYWNKARESFYGISRKPGDGVFERRKERLLFAENRLIKALIEHDPAGRSASVGDIRYAVRAGCLYIASSISVED